MGVRIADNIYNGNTKLNSTPIPINFGSMSQWIINNLSPNTIYSDITIKGVDSDGIESQTSLQVQTLLTLPAKPLNLITSTVSATEIGLEWEAVSGNGEVTYTIYRGTSTSILTPIEFNVNTTSYSDTELNEATQYFYAVQAVNASGNSDLSDESNTTTGVSVIIPSNILVNGSTALNINENQPIGTQLGTITSDGTSPITYSIQSGDTDSFEIVGNILQTSQVFDFETDSFYEVNIVATNAAGSSDATNITISINNSDTQVSNLEISNSSIDENTTGVVGVLTASGTNPKTFTITGGTNSADFSINGSNQLVLNTAAPFESSPLSVEVTVDNIENAPVARTFNIVLIEEGVALSASTLTNININSTSNGTINNPYGYVEYLPEGYSTRDDWPILMWFSGGGEDGNGSSDLVNIANKELMNWLKTNDIPFIVVAPQDASARFDGGKMDEMRRWTRQKYFNKIDPKQFHISVLSATGYGLNTFMRTAGIDFTEVNSFTINAGSDFPQSNEVHPLGIINANCRVWVHHGTSDNVVLLNKRRIFYRNLLLAYGKVNNDIYRFTAYTGQGHDAWRKVFNSTGRSFTQEVGLVDTNNPSVGDFYQWDTETWYEWLLTEVAATGTFTIPSSAESGVSLQFNSDTEYTDSYLWDFGDGNTSTLKNPTHTYTTGGTYNINLTLTNRFGTDTVLTQQQLVVSQGEADTPPENTVAPVITGTETEGQTLSVSNGTWTGTEPIVYAYQWRRGTSDISGADSNTYILQPEDVGEVISCRVTATNNVSSINVLSNSTGVISANVNVAVQTVKLDFKAGLGTEPDWFLVNGQPHSTGSADKTGITNTSSVDTGWTLGFDSSTWVPFEGVSATNTLGQDTGNNSGIYPDTVLNGYFFSNTNNGSNPQPTARFTVGGLDINKKYTIKILGSRETVTGNRITNYTIEGVTQQLSVLGNTSNVVEFTDVLPDAQGDLLIELSLNVASDSTFIYINAMEITEFNL